jgi:hypothetical protein
VGNVKPPGVAPWLYRSHETEQFDDIVLRPKAEVSAVWDLLPYLYLLKCLLIISHFYLLIISHFYRIDYLFFRITREENETFYGLH